MAAPASRGDAADKIKNGLCEALESIQAAGTFAAFSRMKDSSVKPIFVRDVGPVGFPLQESTARQLIEKAHQAPYGKGNETFVDTSVRNTWELDAAQLELSDHQWTKTIDAACKWVAQHLAITAPVAAELYKMLIYEKGAMFKAHTDTEKIPGMFGTLVICLPSEHQGGDLVLKHRDVTKVFKTSETQPSMSCWYSDVSHEVFPVTSGRRWVLTYNLAISHPLHNRPSAALNAPGYSEVRKALRAWLEFRGRNSSDSQPNNLYYLLDHTYTEANISLQGLKGVDRSRMQCLKDVCDDQYVTLLLGVLEKEEIGSCEATYDPYDRGNYYGHRRSYFDDEGEDEDEDDDNSEGGDCDWHSFDDVFETDVSIKKLVNPAGHTLRSDFKIDMDNLEEQLIQNYEDPFETADCGERDYSGFTGNEGVSATHWYRMTIAIIVPNDAVDQFLTEGITRSAAQDLLPRYLTQCSDPKTRDSAMKMVDHLAKLAWSSDKPTTHSYSYMYGGEPKFSPEIAMQFLEIVLRHREYELFSKAVGWFRTQVGTRLFTLVRTAAAGDSFDFTQAKDSLLQNLSIRPVADRMQLLTALSPLDGDTRSPQIRDWVANEVVPSAMKACLGGNVIAADGRAIVTMVREYHDLDYVKARLIPVIEKRVSLTPFALAALLRFTSFAAEGIFEMPVSLELCKPLLKSVVNAMDVTTIRTKDGTAVTPTTMKAQRYDYYQVQAYARDGPPQNRQLFISPGLLAECFALSIQFDWDDLPMLLSFKIVSQVDAIPLTEFRHLWIPFIRELISTLNANNVSLSTPQYQEIARAILEAYLDRHVGKEPSGQVNYRQSPVRCSCADCRLLNGFLQSNERTWRFPAGKGRRQHLHNMLDSAGSGCSHVTERYGNPHTLVVKKGLDAGTRAKKEWNDRFAQAWDDITKFDQEQLKMLLGGEYDKITSMRHLRFPGGAQAQQRVASSRHGDGSSMRPILINGSPVTGVKRRAEG
ncbi:hypothetical protein B0T24DRAFT_545961 [Lasiosphaeria ovina]|uniref:Prolyl 4-hydroxylase alpha subunit Fe(2+) 2OG dioxygenase domain-containing protein n=1 Tax=Lasiosphaeria ovina TaxID=92902 RepID=A0AAE0KM66_9PEZI|nr:hypothetical protein B0T24DRAFT_545961 [Lasiosphaeria ovina]